MPGMFLYNNAAYKKQEENNTITIYFPGYITKHVESGEIKKESPLVIRAVMQEEFKFGMKANWEQILKAGGFSDTIEKAMLVTGNRVHNAGGITKQYYMGSEHIPISTKFRIYAKDGYISPIVAVAKLSQACLPPNGASIETYIKELTDTGKVALNSAKELFEDLTGGEGFIKSLNNFFANITSNVGNVVCHVTFGRWLSGMFVIKSADFTYSKEVSVDGEPYYVDFDVQFESYIIPTKAMFSLSDDVYEGNGGTISLGRTRASRVSFEDQTEG